MSNKDKWDEFLQNATAAEVFSKIGKSITLNDSIPILKRQEMTKQIWDRWQYVRANKQTKLNESEYDSKYYTTEWWGTPD